jgi:hypothetical protein
MVLISGIEDIVAGVVGAGIGGTLFFKALAHIKHVAALRAKAEADGLVYGIERPPYVWTTAKTALMVRPVGLTFVTILAAVGVIGFLSNAFGFVALAGLLIALGGYAKWFTVHIEHRVSDLPTMRPEDVPVTRAPMATPVGPEPVAAEPVAAEPVVAHSVADEPAPSMAAPVPGAA